MTSSAGLPAKSSLETRRPVTSGRLKSGAAVPSESIVDAVAAMALPHVQVRHRPGVPACEYAIRIMTQAPLVPRRSPGIVQGEPSRRPHATLHRRRARPGRDVQRSRPSLVCRPNAVSYTHLRAHETRHDLVCRLLLEK